MNGAAINLKSRRAYEARLSRKIGKNGYTALVSLGLVFFVVAVAVAVVVNVGYGIMLLSPALICFLPAIWWQRYLVNLPPSGEDLAGRLSLDVLASLKPNQPLSAKSVWDAISKNWQASFILHHLILPEAFFSEIFGKVEGDILLAALQTAAQFAEHNGNQTIELGYVIAGLLLAIPGGNDLFIHYEVRPEDINEVTNWLGRNLAQWETQKHQDFGGFGRDWAFGFTPLLNHFGSNISLSIAKYGSHFGGLTESQGVLAMQAAFKNHANAIALIGPVGIGKSNSVYALAQRLIEGRTNDVLAYHQIVELNATTIVSNAHGQGDLEQLMVRLTNEASHARHIILFLDDAELYLSSGPGGFDATQILQSIVQGGGVPIIIALTPNGYQKLKVMSPALAGLLTPVVLQVMDEPQVMKVLEDDALRLENKNHIIITYDAIKEAYRLSDRYEQDEAFPGKAIKLLEQSVNHATSSLVTKHSVQAAIEQTRGVKVGNAGQAEADQLLNLEDRIHERMINQSQAVSVVSNSLRRARAGVTNPRRPIGSFLFLGPTGVGKTELAKALAATYFGAESNMIRLDMSEYQQPEDASRLLSDGTNDSKSLILAIRQQPFSVLLLDEVEKAHPNILNLLLQLLDEGHLTDQSGRQVSFKDAIIIATSNAGAQTIREQVAAGQPIDQLQSQLIDELIKNGQFRPELINRFDEVVVFRPLTPDELVQVVSLMLGEINQTLSTQHITVALTQEAAQAVVRAGYDPRLGARPMRRTLQRAVENTVAQKILRGEAKAGDHIQLDVNDLSF